jgi:hypothetical protein
LSILIGLSALAFGACVVGDVKFENATETIKSLDKHKIIGCGDKD